MRPRKIFESPEEQYQQLYKKLLPSSDFKKKMSRTARASVDENRIRLQELQSVLGEMKNFKRSKTVLLYRIKMLQWAISRSRKG